MISVKHDKLKISKISEELLNYLLSHGSNDISINIKEGNEFYKVEVISRNTNITKEELEKIRGKLTIEKHEEIEEYYWCLAGESDVDTELSLVGMMVDRADVIYNENGVLEIVLYRNKNDK